MLRRVDDDHDLAANTEMKKVLVISYFYPPYDTTAALESSKLTRFLPDLGWSPVVLTAENDYLPTLPLELSEEVVHRTEQIDINRIPKRVLQRNKGVYSAHVAGGAGYKERAAAALGQAYRQVVNLPDAQIGWLPYAVRAGRSLLEVHRPDLIFSIGGPFTDHLVAARLVKGNSIPWFADFRDLWTDNHFFRRVQPLLSFERSLEKRTMSRADALSTATPQWAELLKSRFQKPTWVIPNGFEASDSNNPPVPDDRFVLTYTGVYYSRGQDITPLLAAVSQLHREGAISAADFELRLVGRFLGSVAADVRRCRIEELVTLQEPVSHEEAIRIQASSTALLFLLWTAPEGTGWLSAKVYEYMAAERPILAVGPSDVDAAKLVRSLRAGEVAGDSREIGEILRRWITEFRARGELRVNTDRHELKKYEWRSIAERLAAAFDETIRSQRAGG